MIRAIDRSAVHKICSGQVIVQLQTAVKELVENSLDAGATKVEVKLKEFGANSIEVVDNGCGVSPSNYAGLTLKHHTSKISQFDDIWGVVSFGFRGEALSSLCEVAGSFEVCTRTKEDQVGMLLKYNNHGTLVSKTPKARPVGTTVIVRELFKSIPVRRRDFLKNIKKQYARMLVGLQAYALISTGVRMAVYNQPKSRARSTVLTTQGSAEVRQNVSTVFGAKFLGTLEAYEVDLDADLDGDEDGPSASNDVDVNDGESKHQTAVGFVSKAGTGIARSNNEKQFLYINGRPVDIPKVTKAVNEVWRQYEMKSKPAFIINLVLRRGTFDINVTPDKREVLLTDEAAVLDRLKAGLHKLWAPSRYTFQVGQAQSLLPFAPASQGQASAPSARDVGFGDGGCGPGGVARLLKQAAGDDATATPTRRDDTEGSAGEESRASSIAAGDAPSLDTPQPPSRGFTATGGAGGASSAGGGAGAGADAGAGDGAYTGAYTGSGSGSGFGEVHVESGGAVAVGVGGDGGDGSGASSRPRRALPRSDASPVVAQSRFARSVSVSRAARAAPSASQAAQPTGGAVQSSFVRQVRQARSTQDVPADAGATTAAPRDAADIGGHSTPLEAQSAVVDEDGISDADTIAFDSSPEPDGDAQVVVPDDRQVVTAGDDVVTSDDGDVIMVKEVHASGGDAGNGSPPGSSVTDGEASTAPAAPPTKKRRSRSPHIACPMDLIRQQHAQRRALRSESKHGCGLSVVASVAACAKSDRAGDKVEQEFSRRLTKTHFRKMKVIGQFNKGFIIAQIGSDLFILDQHACDEKVNFERLQRTTVIQQQPLIRPMPLEVTAGEELIIMEHMATFEANGFKFVVNDDASATQKLKLVALPYSKGTQFGTSDIHELASLLTDRQKGDMVRLPKAMAMFASRACRSAIMIGDGLSLRTMTKVVHGMSLLNQPWNCPHGRPTMRHLVDLDHVRSIREKRKQQRKK